MSPKKRKKPGLDSRAPKRQKASTHSTRHPGHPHRHPEGQRPEGSRRDTTGSIAALRMTKGGKAQMGLFKSFDGTPVHYEVVGQGPPLLFCYGLVCNMRSFRHQREFFQKNYQCIFFDYRGHQKSRDISLSSKNALEYTTRDMMALIKHLGHDKVTLIGHSMGVNVSFRFALKHPNRTAALVWINGTLNNPFAYMFRSELSAVVFDFLKEFYLSYPNAFASAWHLLIANRWVPTLLTAPLGFNILLSQKHDIDNYIEGVIETPHTTLMEFLVRLSATHDHNKLKKLKNIPVLLCAGARDLITPIEKQKEIAKHIPRSTFVEIPHGSHNVHLDMPQLINLSIDKFLREKVKV